MVDHRLPLSSDSMLQTLAASARDALPTCDSAGVTLVDAGEVTGRGCTDPVAQDLDWAQSRAGEGPCLDALRFLQIFNVPSIADVEEWPVFRRTASTNGIRSSLSVPLYWGGRAIGTVNLYSRILNGFEDCERVAMGFASRAAAALLQDEARNDAVTDDPRD